MLDKNIIKFTIPKKYMNCAPDNSTDETCYTDICLTKNTVDCKIINNYCTCSDESISEDYSNKNNNNQNKSYHLRHVQ